MTGADRVKGLTGSRGCQGQGLSGSRGKGADWANGADRVKGLMGLTGSRGWMTGSRG